MPLLGDLIIYHQVVEQEARNGNAKLLEGALRAHGRAR